MENGIGWGNFSLTEKAGFVPGTYTIYAYTNWQQNFGQGYFFSKNFYITGSGEDSWFVNENVNLPAGKSDSVQVKLSFNDISKMPDAHKMLRLHVISGNKQLLKRTMQTDDNGMVDLNVKLQDNPAGLSITAESVPEGRKAIIPVRLNSSQNADLQFLPEGGVPHCKLQCTYRI